MNRKLNITDFKDASYFSERKISSHDLGDGLKSRKRKEYWDNFIGEGSNEFWKYLQEKNDFSKHDLDIFLEEHTYDVKDIDSFSHMDEFIEFFFKRNDYTLPEFYIVDSEGKRKPIFSNFVIPFLKFAAYKLEDNLSSQNLKVTRDVLNSLLIALFQQILNISYRTLILELQVLKEQNMLKGETGEKRFKYFSEIYLSDHFWDILKEYPVMFRLIIENIQNWVTNNVEFLTNLKEDKALLQEHFSINGELTKIESGVSDFHNHGKSVYLLWFGTNKLVYKPRDLILDVKFQNLLSWYNLKFNKNLYVTNILNRGNYGWVEYIEHLPCTYESDFIQFYTYLGYLLFLLFAMRGNDIHFENIIAKGNRPVLVDIETLFHNTTEYRKEYETADKLIFSLLEKSVKRVGILPNIVWGKDGNSGVDISGLSSSAGEMIPIERASIMHSMTDEMKIGYEQSALQSKDNQPFIQSGKDVDLNSYKNYVSAGFKEAYEIISKDPSSIEEFLVEIEKFNNAYSRQIMRPTQFYSNLIQTSYHPSFLRSGLDREMLFSKVWKIVFEDKKVQRIASSEFESLLLGDIPLFQTKISDRFLCSELTKYQNFFNISGMELAIQQIKDFCQKDMEFQLNLIETTLNYDPSYNLVQDSFVPLKPSVKVIRNLNQKEIQETKSRIVPLTEKIADYLSKISYSGTSGDICWVDMNILGEKTNDWNMVPIGCDLYNGISGIMLFYLFLYLETKKKDYLIYLKKCYRSLKYYLDSRKQFATHSQVLFGGFSGETPIIYVLLLLKTRMPEHFNSDELDVYIYDIIDDLKKGYRYDENFDVLVGSAGAIIHLLNVFEVTRDEELLILAHDLFSHLEKNSTKITVEGQDGRAWKGTMASNPLAGFAHGVSGIVWALSKLSRYFPEDKKLKTIIKQGIIFENSMFDTEKSNWSDYRETESGIKYKDIVENIPVSWCHGAPGILISRLELYKNNTLNVEFRRTMKSDMDVAIDTTIKYGFGKSHCLCHGDLGNLNILFYVAKKMSSEHLYNVVYSYLNTILDDLESENWKCGLPYKNSPSLMSGIAGIGLGLLTLNNLSIPSVINLEIW